MSAIISECGKYRYYLTRKPGDNPLVFCMLNPSTADASIDDPTIRRCRRFASDLGYSGLIVVNLFAYRATAPADLKAAGYPVGPDNDWHISSACTGRDVICAWGANAPAKRATEVLELLKKIEAKPHHLGLTKGGMPKHPLYIKSNQQMIKWG